MPTLKTKVISVHIDFNDATGIARSIPISSRVILPQDWNQYATERDKVFQEVQDLEYEHLKIKRSLKLHKKALKEYEEIDENLDYWSNLEKALNEKEVKILNQQSNELRKRNRNTKNELWLQKILTTVLTIGLVLK